MKKEKKNSRKCSITSNKKSESKLKTVYSGSTPSGIEVVITEATEGSLVFLSLDFTCLVLPTEDFKDLVVDMMNAVAVLTGGKNKSKRKSKRV